MLAIHPDDGIDCGGVRTERPPKPSNPYTESRPGLFGSTEWAEYASPQQHNGKQGNHPRIGKSSTHLTARWFLRLIREGQPVRDSNT